MRQWQESSPCILCNVLIELFMICLSQIRRKCYSLVYGVCQLLCVPWVDNDTSVQTLSCAGEFRKNHNSMSFLLSRDVLVRNEIHAVPSRANKTNIGNGVKGDKLFKVDALMHEVNRHKLNRALG